MSQPLNPPYPQEETPLPQNEYAQQFSPVPPVQEPLTVLLTWHSWVRPFITHSREFYTTAGSIIFLTCIILLFLKEFLFIMVLIAFAFFMYIMSTVEPERVEHRITNRGVFTGKKLYTWDELGRFWFDKKGNDEMVMIENFSGLPTRLMLLLGDQTEETIKGLLGKHLLMEKPEKSQMERASDWLQYKFPLETNKPIKSVVTSTTKPPEK